MSIPSLVWIPLLPLLGALINLTIGRRMSRAFVHTVSIAAVASSCALCFWMIFGVPGMGGGEVWRAYKAGAGGTGVAQTWFTWIEVGNLKIDLAFTLDTLSSVMVLIVTFVGTLIHIYSTGYMAHDRRYAAFFGYLNLFTGAMLILVLGSNLPVMFIGWEGVGLCSYLLIGFWYENENFASAGRKAFIVNRIGDFFFLLGMFLLFWATKTLDFEALSSQSMGAAYVQPFWGGERLAAAAAICLFIGACGKSAQLPLFVWLPDAMAGPTPVSALIHAATMVTAGVYMVCRMSFLFSASTTAMIVVATVGMLTALSAAFMAFAQTDLKKVLAYSTVSQLGFMFVAAGTGNWVAAIFHLGTHAFFKACLFLGAGSVMHGMEHGIEHAKAEGQSSGDIMKMGGLRKHMTLTWITFLISCLAIAGIFPFSGFFSKDEILAGAWGVTPPGWPVWYGKVLWGGLLIAAAGTAIYMWRLYFLVFHGAPRSEAAKHVHESPNSMTMPLVVLATLATLAGVIGFPHLTGIHLPSFTHALSSWLAPSVTPVWFDPGADGVNAGQAIAAHASNGTIIGLALLAFAIGVIGIVVAWMFYGRGPSRTLDKLTEGDGALAGAYRASKAKLWFDEIYDAALVRPFKVVARGMYEIVDKFIIDTIAVNGAAVVVGVFGRVSRWFQNGQVQRYLTGLVIGAAAMFFITDCHEKPGFSYEIVGDRVHLVAAPGAGLVGARSSLQWDIDGDGAPDTDPNTGKIYDTPELYVRLGDTRTKVSLYIVDPITRKTRVVTRVLRLPALDQRPADPGNASPKEGR